MRQAIYSILKELFPQLPVYEAGAMDTTPPNNLRFATVRFGGVTPGVGGNGGPRVKVVEIHFHDAPGSYTWIDDCLLAVDSRLAEIEHYQNIAGATFESNSTDLFDDGYRTITKFTRHRLVGRGM